MGGVFHSAGQHGAAALSLDGQTGYLSLPHEVLDGAGDFSFEAWGAMGAGTQQPTLLSGANATSNNEIALLFQNDGSNA
jgi:hypothetical protein